MDVVRVVAASLAALVLVRAVREGAACLSPRAENSWPLQRRTPLSPSQPTPQAIIVYGFHPIARYRLRSVPGRSPSWLIGGVRVLRARGAATVHAADRAAFGPSWLSWGATRPFFMTVAPSAVRHTLLTNYNRPAFQTPTNNTTLWRGRSKDAAFEKASLLSARDAHHHALRSRLWSPMFYKGSLEAAKPVVAAHADALAERSAAAAAKAGGTWDAASDFKSTTLDVIGSIAFGVDFRAAETGSVGAELRTAIDEILSVNGLSFSIWGTLMLLFPVAAPLIRFGASVLPDAGLKRLRATRARVITVAERLLADHRAAVAAAGDSTASQTLDVKSLRSGVAPGSFLDVCMRAVDPKTGLPFDDVEIVQSCFLAILAGTETTGNALTFAVHCLTQHAEVLSKLVAEIEANAPAGMPTSQLAEIVTSASSFPYLDAVFRETLRLYPPAPMLARELGEASTIDGHALPAGTWVATPLLVLHRDAAVWGDTALDFKPERFLPGHPAAAPPAALKGFLPFGEGARKCPAGSGRGGLAELEFKTVLASLLRVVTPRAVEGQPVPLPVRQTITLAPRDGLTVVLEARGAAREA